MPKQCSTRSTTRKRRIGRTTKMVDDCEAMPDRSLAPQEISLDYAEVVRQMVLESWPAIVKGLIKKAVAGGHQQAKFLLDMYDLMETEASELNEQHSQRLCDALLEGFTLSNDLTDEAAEGFSGHEDN